MKTTQGIMKVPPRVGGWVGGWVWWLSMRSTEIFPSICKRRKTWGWVGEWVGEWVGGRAYQLSVQRLPTPFPNEGGRGGQRDPGR